MPNTIKLVVANTHGGGSCSCSMDNRDKHHGSKTIWHDGDAGVVWDGADARGLQVSGYLLEQLRQKPDKASTYSTPSACFSSPCLVHCTCVTGQWLPPGAAEAEAGQGSARAQCHPGAGSQPARHPCQYARGTPKVQQSSQSCAARVQLVLREPETSFSISIRGCVHRSALLPALMPC